MNADQWFQKGLHHLEMSGNADYASEYRSDLEEAAAAFAECLALNTEHLDALRLRGFTLAKLEQPHEALDCLVAAAALAPNDADVLRTAGECTLALQQFDRAVPLFEQALKVAPNEEEALVGLATARMKLGDDERTAVALDAAIANIQPQSMRALSLPWLHMARAACLARLKRPDTYDVFLASFELLSDRLHGPSAPQEFWRSLADFEVARDAYRAWVARHQADEWVLFRAASAWSAAARVHDSEELHRVALASWELVVAKQPTNATAWREKGDVHAALGEFDAAITHFAEALRLEPDSIAASRRLNETKQRRAAR